MRQAIISDTHSNKWTLKAYNSMLGLREKLQLDSVVYNGDLIGHFSLAKSNPHRNMRISQEELDTYLEQAAPLFYKEWKQTGTITSNMVYEFVGERYSWIVKFLKQSSKEIKTIWNLGNHESKHFFLVLHEIPFLTGCDTNVIENVNHDILEKIYDMYLEKIKDLERTHNFHYIGDKHVILDNTMIIGIPGQSHGTVGRDKESVIQEEETKRILDAACEELGSVENVLIYNHTQGNYMREHSLYQPASNAAKEFMKHIPATVQNKIFVQSHNHWSYTQVLQPKEFVFILNNAGLHGGIYNIIDVTKQGVKVLDVDPYHEQVTKLKISSEYGPDFAGEREKVLRNYPDAAKVLARKTRYQNN